MGTSPVYKRGDVWWHRDPVTKRRRSTKLKNRKAAIELHEQRVILSKAPHYRPENQETLGVWLTKMLRDKRAAKAEGTVKMYEIKARHLARVLGEDRRLLELNPGLIDEYITTRREEGAKQTTIYREMVTLTQTLKAARRSRVFHDDPKSLLPTDWSNKYTPRVRNLTLAEIQALLVALRDQEQRAWVAFILCTGARFSEAQSHEPGDFNPETGIMTIRGTKTAGSRRGVPILAPFTALWALVTDYWQDQGRAPRWPMASKRLPEAAARAGIDHVTPNDLRRTHASWLIHFGVNQAMVSRALGHSDGTMVARVYGQVTPAQLADLMRGQLRSGTPETQEEALETEGESIEPKQARPLGETGRRGGFKILSGVRDKSASTEFPRLAGAGDGWERALSGTPTAQFEPSVWALAYAAERVGVLPERRAL
jgi:integrase